MAVDKAAREGSINLWTGRQVPVDPNATYTAWNYLCQGAVGEMVKRSIVQIAEAYRENNLQSRIALDEHDALILSIHHSEWESALGIATYFMETVIPAEYNERTEPPIRWIARPDMPQNAAKWGKLQYHPSNDTTETVDLPQNANLTANQAIPVAEPTIPELVLDDNTPAPLHRINIPSLGFEWEGRVRLQVPPKQWNHSERVEALRFLTDLLTCVDTQQRETFEVVLPAKTATGIGLGQTVTVNKPEHWKIAALWSQVAAQGVDTEALLGEGMTAEGLEKLALERKQEAESLDQVVERCIEAIDRLEGQLGVNATGGLDPMEIPF